MAVITLTTDFGLQDGYVGQVKGVILSIHPRVTLVDLSHQIPSYDIEAGAFLLGTSFFHFPQGTVHLAVVDPGVGSARRPILVVTKNYLFVAPDNGLLSLVVQRDPPKALYELTQEKYFGPSVSHTFHGRDLFAPVAAHLSRGLPPHRLGRRIPKLHTLDLFQTRNRADGEEGQILFFDKFGNAITNLHVADPRSCDGVVLRGEKIPFFRTYSEIPRGEPGALIGSSGFLELAIYEGSFEGQFHPQKGDRIFLKRR